MMTSTQAPPALTPCPPERAFRFANGDAARDLPGFRAVAAKLEVPTLEWHRTHFHHWMLEVLEEPALAEDVRALGERGDVAGEAYREALLGVVDARVSALEAPEKPRAKKPAASSGRAVAAPTARKSSAGEKKPATKKKSTKSSRKK